MTNKEKAKELAKLKDYPDSEERYYNPFGCKIYDTAIEMAEWKEKDIIEKVKTWLKEHAADYIECDDWDCYEYKVDELLEDFDEFEKGL